MSSSQRRSMSQRSVCGGGKLPVAVGVVSPFESGADCPQPISSASPQAVVARSAVIRGAAIRSAVMRGAVIRKSPPSLDVCEADVRRRERARGIVTHVSRSVHRQQHRERCREVIKSKRGGLRERAVWSLGVGPAPQRLRSSPAHHRTLTTARPPIHSHHCSRRDSLLRTGFPSVPAGSNAPTRQRPGEPVVSKPILG